jgi:hypothetical protein
MKHVIDIYTLKRELDEIRESFPTWTTDNAFVHWFLRAFLVSQDEAVAKAVTGVSHDKGVDAVFIDEQAEKVFIVQGKCHLRDSAPSENRAEVMSFARLAWTLLDSDPAFSTYKTGIDPLVGEKLQVARQRVKRRLSRCICTMSLLARAAHR